MSGELFNKVELKLAVVAMAVLGIVIYAGSQEKAQGEEYKINTEAINTHDPRAVEKEADWVIYHSEKYGFSIDYPKILEVSETENRIILNTRVVRKGAKPVTSAGATMEIYDRNGSELKMLVVRERISIEEKYKNDKSKNGRGVDMTMTNVTPVVVSGKVGYSFEIRGDKNYAIVYLPLKELRLLKIQFDQDVLGKEDSWEKMLSHVTLE